MKTPFQFSGSMFLTGATPLARMEDRMAAAKREQKPNKEKKQQKSKKEEDRQLSEELDMSFPASDPPAATEPGSGITGAIAPRK